jgi:hypothetical protein
MPLTVIGRESPRRTHRRETGVGRSLEETRGPETVGGMRCRRSHHALTRCEIPADNIGVDFTSEDLRARVEPVVDVVRIGLEAGLECVDPIRDGLGLSPDPWFDSHIVRRVARARIERAAKTSGDSTWQIDCRVPNSGIHLFLARARVRLAHGSVKRVPPPGRNLARKDFWSQRELSYIQDPLPIFDLGAVSSGARLNLLLLWTALDGAAISLAVAVPRGEWPFGSTARLHAYVPLEADLPAEFVGDDDEGDDLVARIDDEDEAGGELP